MERRSLLTDYRRAEAEAAATDVEADVAADAEAVASTAADVDAVAAADPDVEI